MIVGNSDSALIETNMQVNAMTADPRKMAKLYFMMSNSLYNDKMMSILRELCSNCQDAHVEAGKVETPFTIVAPTPDNPYLRISDVGTGMTYEKAQTSILMFLGSTKDEGADADNYIGGWGIGAKAPRAYTSEYQVEVRKDGVEAVIQVFNDEKGFPNETLIMSRKTNRPNGVDFILPVELRDVVQWRKKIEEYVSMTNYNVVAYMGDGEVITPPKPTFSFDYGDFALDVYGYAARDVRTSDSLPVIYGGMAYEIPSALGLSFEIRQVLTKAAAGFKYRIRIDKPNLVKFGLSREGLEVEPSTTDFLTKVILKLKEDLTVPSTGLSQKYNRSGVTTWAQVLEASALIEEKAKEVKEKTPLWPIVRSHAETIYLSPVQYVEINTDGVRKRASFPYALPLNSSVKPPKITLLWSDKRPLVSDMRKAAEWDGFILCPKKCSTQEEALAWFETAKSEDGKLLYEGFEVQPTYVMSTRTAGSRSSSDSSRGTIQCAVRNKRYQLKTQQIVVVGSEKDFWIEEVMPSVTALVMTPTQAKRGVPDDECVSTLEEFLDCDEVKEELKSRFAGAKVGSDALDSAYKLRQALCRIELCNMTDDMQKGYNRVTGDLYICIDQVSKAKQLYDHLTSKYEGLTFEVPDYPELESAIRAGNRKLVELNRLEETLQVVDFDCVKEEIARGNPQAKRIAALLQIEEYVC